MLKSCPKRLTQANGCIRIDENHQLVLEDHIDMSDLRDFDLLSELMKATVLEG